MIYLKNITRKTNKYFEDKIRRKYKKLKFKVYIYAGAIYERIWCSIY